MKANLRLEIPEDPEKNLGYYYVMRIIPYCQPSFSIIKVTIPLIDKSLQMNLYKICNLTVLHPHLTLQVTYVLEGQYLAVSKHGMYTTLPTKHDVHLCVATQGYLCMRNQALYLVEQMEWCIWASFIHKHECINKYCLVNSKLRHDNMAVSLDGLLWAVSSLFVGKLRDKLPY